MKEHLERIEKKLDVLIEKTEHRVTALEVNCVWLKRSFYGLLSFLSGLALYVIRPLF
jgi:hypothetical protein